MEKQVSQIYICLHDKQYGTIDGYNYVSSLSLDYEGRASVRDWQHFRMAQVKTIKAKQSGVYSSLRQALVLSRETQGS